jgi:ParB-like chromosome segregation protein Spo0J
MISINDIVVDEEFDSLLPELSSEEKLELSKSIEKDGFTDPIIVWLNHGTIVDGHNRFRIWKQFHEHDQNRVPDIIEKAFKDRDDVKEFMLRHQLARRNLTDASRVAVTLLLKPFLEKKASKNQSAAAAATNAKKSGNTLPANLPEASPVDVRKELSEVAGVSERTFAKAEAVLKSDNEEAKAAMLAPKSDPSRISIDKAYKQVKNVESTNTDKPGLKRWEQGASSLPEVREHAPEDDDPPAVFTLKQDWRRASKKDRRTFLKWAEENV